MAITDMLGPVAVGAHTLDDVPEHELHERVLVRRVVSARARRRRVVVEEAEGDRRPHQHHEQADQERLAEPCGRTF